MESKPDEIKVSNKTYSFYVGPYFGAKASVSTNVSGGRKVGVAMGFPDAGVSVVLPFFRDRRRGMQVNFGYESYAYITKPEKNADDANTIKEKYAYINISPMLHVSGFIVGLNIGIPVSASASNLAGGDEIVYTAENTEMLSLISTNIEAKVGFNIPIINLKTGMLNFNIVATYALTGYYKDADTYKFSDSKMEFNPIPAGLHLGFSYLFKIGDE